MTATTVDIGLETMEGMLLMNWLCADMAPVAAVDPISNYLVVTNAGQWGDGCLHTWRGWDLQQRLCEKPNTGRARVVCYAKIQDIPTILKWAHGEAKV